MTDGDTDSDKPKSHIYHAPVIGVGDVPPEEFGRRLKAARIAAGYTSLRKAAAPLGVSVQTYHDLEAGRSSPGFSRVLTIVRLLGLDPRIIAPEWFQEPSGHQ